MKHNLEIKNSERLDDLNLDGLAIIQEKDGYCFTSDSILLANYIKTGHKDNVIELCAGSGVISCIVAYKKRPKSVTMVEIQEDQADRARRSFLYNNIEANILSCRFQGVHEKTGKYFFDVCYANPPYRQENLDQNKNKTIALSTHELEMNLEELIVEAESLLKFGGRFYLVYPAGRMAELIYLLKKYKMEPKNISFIHPKSNKNAELLLIESVKGAKPGLIISPVIIQKDENNNDTDIIKKIYNSRN